VDETTATIKNEWLERSLAAGIPGCDKRIAGLLFDKIETDPLFQKVVVSMAAHFSGSKQTQHAGGV